MALIKCPGCDQKISDKSKYCIHCGFELQKDQKICDECGALIKDETDFCDKCGCPINNAQKVEITKINLNNNKNIKKIVSIFIILLVIFGIVSSIVITKRKIENENALSEYKHNIREAVRTMINGAAEAEECGNMIHDIWRNTIYEESDAKTDKYTKNGNVFNESFNSSLGNFFSSKEYDEYTSNIYDNKYDVQSLMKKLKNPPEEWEDAYDDLNDLYDGYLKMTGMCLDPTGNLQTYTTNLSNADNETYNAYQKMQSYFD